MGRNSPYSDRPSFDAIRRAMTRNIHFVGIGGVSMYTLARLALNMGAAVSGSDRELSSRTEILSELGASVYVGHNCDNIGNASLVVYSHAIEEHNPELVCARERGILTVNRAEYMGAMMLDYRTRIGVSGSHGKSTTVAMLETIFSHARANPTVLCGADLPSGDPLMIGDRGMMIYEACEYRDSFLRFLPTVAIALNLELDHTDYFPDLSALKESFVKALSRAEQFAVISGDDKNLQSIMPKISTDVISFGRGRDNIYRYDVTAFEEGNFLFDLYKFDNKIGSLRLNIPGVFNVHNASCAAVVALELGVDFETVRSAIASFLGIPRRLEYLGEVNGRPLYYDYAHHPTEIRASLTALRGLTKGNITLLFKPHTYTRTVSLWDELRGALSLADHTVITDIYAAREESIEGVSGHNLAEVMGPSAVYMPDSLAAEYILNKTDGAIVLMGAGDVTEIKRQLTR